MTIEDTLPATARRTEFAQLSPAQRFTPNENTDRPLRLLAVGINFGPEHTGIAPYTTQLCEHLVAQGMDVTVFTGITHYPSWTVDPHHAVAPPTNRTPGTPRGPQLRHYVPKKQTALRRAWYELSFALQVAMQRPTEQPDVVLAVVPSLLSAVAAQRIAERAGVPLVVWVQDLMGRAAAQSGIDGGARVANLVSAIERQVLRSAESVMVLNSHFADYVKSIGVDDKRVTIRPNWTHITPPSGVDRAIVRARMGWRDDETIVLHTGNMGLKQDLGNVIDAARLARDRGLDTIRFVLMGDGSQRRELQRAAQGVNTVHFLPPASSSAYADVLAAADILLVNEAPSSLDMSLPSKLTSYFHAGRPVLAASPDTGGTAKLIRTAGAGVVVAPGDPKSLLIGATELSADLARRHTLGTRGHRFAAARLGASRSLDGVAQVVRECQQSATRP